MSTSDEVVERIRHRVTPASAGGLGASDDAYRAAFDDAGFSLASPDARGDGLTVSLDSLHRGDRAVGLDPGGWQGDENVARRDAAPGVTEQVTARDGELEWDVVLDRPLPGGGDLRVEATVDGALGDPQRSAHELRFRLADGSVVRMGELVVVDATGAELHRALPSVTDGRLALDVPAAVLASAAYPLTLDPTVGPERAVVMAPLDQAAPAAATFPSNGEEPDTTLVVWEDRRGGDQYDIRAARVSPDGVVLDPDGLPIASQPAIDERDPAVTWVPGSGFLVVWEQEASPGSLDIDLWAVRVGLGGTLTGSAVTVTNTIAAETDPAVASNGVGAVVVWTLQGGNVTGARVNGLGSVEAVVSVGGSGPKRHPAIAWSGSRFLVVWQSNSTDIQSARLSSTGALVSNVTISVAAGIQSRPHLAWNGSRFLVAWQDTRNGRDEIFAARVTNGGTLEDAGGFAITTGSFGRFSPAVVATGSGFVVGWVDGRETPEFDLFAARVANDGSVLDPEGFVVSAATRNQVGPALAPSGSASLVVWTDARWGEEDIYGARVGSAGAVLDPAGIAVSTAARAQVEPAVAFDGSNALVAWEQGITGSRTIGAVRVGADGRILDDAGIPLAAPGYRTETDPAVAWNGSSYLVVWEADGIEEDADIWAARVSAGGGLVGSLFPVTSVAGNERDPAVAWTGSSFLVAWEDDRNGVDVDVFASRVSSTGTVADGPGGRAVATAAGDQDAPDVGADGANGIVVWEDGRTGDGSGDIRAARVTASTGTVGTSFVVSGADHRQDTPAVAWNGARYLVAWRDGRGGSITSNVFAARVTAAGAVQDTNGIPVSTAPQNQELPDVAASGSTFLVAWRDNRASGYNLFGTTVTDAGAVQDNDGFLLSGWGGDEGGPALTRRSGGWGLTYDRPVTDSRGVLFRTISAK